MKGSPADPNRIYASQSSGWFGQVIPRSDDGGKTWEPVGTWTQDQGRRVASDTLDASPILDSWVMTFS
jgi:hypothetical protein